MAKNTPSNNEHIPAREPASPPQKPVLDGAKQAADQWARESKASKDAGVEKHAVKIPGGEGYVFIAKLEYEGNKVSVWTSSDTSLAPDFVIVNPPTQVFLSKDNIVENPLGVIAHTINGASA